MNFELANVKSSMAVPMQSAAKGTRLSGNVTSFQKKNRSKLIQIPGTKPSVHTGQLIISSGVPSLDCALGGGLAVGSLLLIGEDEFDSYSRALLQYFLAEGIMSGHELFIASAQDHPEEIIKEIPSPLQDEETEFKTISQTLDQQDTMKIAWRYQNLPKVQTVLSPSSHFCHYYDLAKHMGQDRLQNAKIHTFYLPEEQIAPTSLSDVLGPYSALLHSIQLLIKQNGFDGSNSQNKTIRGRMIRLSDTAITLQSFSDAERNNNPLYKDYHGLLHVVQVPQLNCLGCEVPDTKDLAFRVKRKQFTIERMFLPPDLSESVSRVSKAQITPVCTSDGNKHLDY
ncbi:elongator complex protein 4 isoform X2 [Silurus meridionalis]|uniref:elongator complex protein 4 isoform X2 n=1 Tax=Silurus meridionalis TaxID=175797 RepID=UPI001EECC3A3|nr:elongator complex protein 4 isoform X2 [Silurus meridionalis]